MVGCFDAREGFLTHNPRCDETERLFESGRISCNLNSHYVVTE